MHSIGVSTAVEVNLKNFQYLAQLANNGGGIFDGGLLLHQAFHRLFIAQFKGAELLVLGKAADGPMRPVQQYGRA